LDEPPAITIHVHNLAAEENEFPAGSSDAKRQGHRTILATPLLREGAPIGVISIRRWEVRPFYAKQIALLENFADQSVIAIENARLFEAERQRSLALAQVQAELAHVSRVTTLGQLTASIAHEVTQPIAAARINARAALNFLDAQPPDLGEVKEVLSWIVDDADRAGAIIDRIRDHIKKAPPRRERFDLNAAINEVIMLAQSAINTSGVSVQTCVTEEVLTVQGDRVQVQQVLLRDAGSKHGFTYTVLRPQLERSRFAPPTPCGNATYRAPKKLQVSARQRLTFAATSFASSKRNQLRAKIR
jgi:signal transduction histidine kinase